VGFLRRRRLAYPGRAVRFGRLTATGLRTLLPALRGLDMADRRAICLAFYLLAYASSVVDNVKDPSAFRSLVCICQKRLTRPGKSVEPEEVVLEEVLWSVHAAAGCFPDARCLVEAAVQFLLLRRSGVAAALVIGIRRGDHRGIDGHAWVEVDGTVPHQWGLAAQTYCPIIRVG
jgi:hypothetical protein